MQETKCIGGLSDVKWGSQYHQQDRVYSMGKCALELPAQIPEGSYKYMEIKIIGKMDHTMDHTFESANSITTVQKDNMVLIRQATKEGFIPCGVGGGGRSELSRQQDKKRPSAREWTDMPDSDNGEYP